MQTQASEYFSGLKNSLTDLVLDYGRAKLIDVESKKDDKRINDAIDAKLASQGVIAGGVGGLSFGTIAIVGVLAVVGLIVVKKVI